MNKRPEDERCAEVGFGGRPAAAALAEYAREQVLRRKLEAVMKAELTGQDPRWIEQAFSPLGPRKHIAAVRRRVAEAEARGISAVELGAAVLESKRKYLLTPESVAEELGRAPLRKTMPAVNDTEEAAYADFMARASSRG